MLEVKTGIDTGLDVVVKPRLNILYMVIYELAEQFGANSICLETIRKGILDKQFIINDGYDEKYGARPLRRTIQSKVEDALAEKILEGSIKQRKTGTTEVAVT